MQTIRYEGVYNLLSPLCHSAPERTLGEKGTVTYLRRIPIATSVINVGYGVSGAEIRTLMKMLVLDYVIEKLKISINGLPEEVAILLYSGGRGESGSPVDYKIIEKIKEEIPIVGVFGGTINGHFIPSSLFCDFAYVLTKESSNLYPGLIEVCNINKDDLIYMEDFKTAIYKYGYGHARHRSVKIAHLDTIEGNKIQMPYYIEAIPAGTKLLHGFTLIEPSEGIKACFEAALKLFLDYGYLGGRHAAGYGRFKANYYDADNQPFIPGTKNFDDWLDKNGEVMKESLLKLTETLPSNADAKALEACEWIVKNKATVQRIIEGVAGLKDIEELFNVQEITEDNFKKVTTLFTGNNYKAVVEEVCNSGYDSGVELYESMDAKKRKAIGELYNKSNKAAKEKPKKRAINSNNGANAGNNI